MSEDVVLQPRDPYRALAPLYDGMARNADIQALYGEWRAALLAAARARGVRVATLVDLACGTGNSTVPWTLRPHLSVLGVDRSAAMLEVARRKSSAVTWVRQDITALRLRVRADAVTCHFDALNHVLTLEGLNQVCVGVARMLTAGGLFQFDLNTRYWLRWLHDRDKLFELDGPVFTATSTLDPTSNVATFRQVWFVPRGRLFQRHEVVVQERSFTDAEVRRALRHAGLRLESIAVQRAIGHRPIRKLYLAVKPPTQP